MRNKYLIMTSIVVLIIVGALMFQFTTWRSKKQLLTERDIDFSQKVIALENFFKECELSLERDKNIYLSGGHVHLQVNDAYRWKGATLSDYYHKHASNIYYVSTLRDISDIVRQFINKSATLERVWEENAKRIGGSFASQYIFDPQSNVIRVFPWLNTVDLFGQYIDLKTFSFFINSLPTNNQTGKMICSKAGPDYGGYGLVTACAMPVSLESQSPVVVGVDISFRNVPDRIESNLLWKGGGEYFLIDPVATIVLKPKRTKYNQLNAVMANATRDETFNKCVDKILRESTAENYMRCPDGGVGENGKYYLMAQKVKYLDWPLVLMTSTDE